MWTITDFPAYVMLSGWGIKGNTGAEKVMAVILALKRWLPTAIFQHVVYSL